MKRKLALLLALPLLTICSSCTGKTSPRKLRTNYTGDLVGEFKQSKLGSSVKMEDGTKVKDQKFVFSVKISAENNVIKSIGWNEANSKLLYTKNAWDAADVEIIKDQSEDFFNLFKDTTFEDVYYSLIAHDNIFNEAGDTVLYPSSTGATVRYDSLDFSKGSNNSKYKYWSNISYEKPSEAKNIAAVGLLVEIGTIMAIYHAITTA